MDKFKERCRETDTEGFSLIFPKDELYDDCDVDVEGNIHFESERSENIEDEICQNYEQIVETLEPEEKEE